MVGSGKVAKRGLVEEGTARRTHPGEVAEAVRSRTAERPSVDGLQLGSSPGGPARQATNSRLRTGTDKGNPTV